MFANFQSVISEFIGRCAPELRDKITVYETPTEEIKDALARDKPITLHQAGALTLARGRGAKSRLEQNYLYDSRRLPGHNAAEVFPGVQLATGDYNFFQSAIGQPSNQNGFKPSVGNMSDLETNMDVPGQIAQGKNFVMHQLGVSFNADIANADCATLMESGALRYSKQGGQFTLKHGPIRQWPGGTGVYGHASTTVAATTIASASNGYPSLAAARGLKIPRIIKEKDQFTYIFSVPRAIRNTSPEAADTNITLTAPCVMTIWLWGGQKDRLPT